MIPMVIVNSFLYLKQVSFYDSKNLKKQGSNLTMVLDPTFSETIPVSFNNSVIHVPTDVYEGSKSNKHEL